MGSTEGLEDVVHAEVHELGRQNRHQQVEDILLGARRAGEPRAEITAEQAAQAGCGADPQSMLPL